MEENKEMVEKVSEEAVNTMLEEQSVGSNIMPAILIGVVTLGVGFLVYKGVKYFKNRNKYVDITPNNVRDIYENDESEEE